MKNRPSGSKAGLTKRKIKGKDGITRTYWVSTAKASFKKRSSAARTAKKRRKLAAPLLATSAASAVALGGYLGVKIGIERISADRKDFFWPRTPEDHQKVEETYSQFQPGDLIERCFTVDFKISELAARHYAVYMGKDPQTGQHMVVHARANASGAPIVAEEPIDAETSELSPVRVVQSAYKKAKSVPPTKDRIAAGAPKTQEEILDRARFIASQPHRFDVLKSNCESVARGIVEGEAVSLQGQTRDIVAQVGGTILTQLVARQRWMPGSLTAQELTTQANRFTAFQRRDNATLTVVGRDASVDEVIANMEKFTGDLGARMRERILADWLISLYLTSGGEVRQDAAKGKGVKCGKSYISSKRKCRRGIDRARESLGAANQRGVASESLEGSALEIANKKGFLGKIAVDKEDFLWPGNGVMTDEVKANYDLMKKGDLIENAFLSQGKYVRHYGVYAGKDEDGRHLVYQVAKKEGGSGQIIKKEPMDTKKPIEFSAWRKTPPEEMYQKSNTRTFSREDVIKRAEATIGTEFHYNTFRSNCEHYARGIVEGRAYSSQSDKTSPFTHVAGDVISVGIRKKVGKNGLTAGEITGLVNYISSKEGTSRATVPSLFVTNKRTDSNRFSFGDLCSPDEFESRVQRVTADLPGTGGDILRGEMYSNYFMLLFGMFADRKEKERRDSRKKRPKSKKGLVKKKIRDKRGVLRTYWVRSRAEVKREGKPPRHGGSQIATKVAGSVLAASAAYGTKRVLESASALKEASLDDSQKRRLEFTENGMPSEETYSRYDRDFQKGDLIRKSFSVAGKDFYHYAVYAGKNSETGEREIYQTGAPGSSGRLSPHIVKAPIHVEEEASPSSSMYERVPESEMYRKGGRRFSREEIVARAEGLVGNAFEYKVTKNNCESLARLIVEGEHYTTQGQNVSSKTKKIFDDISAAIASASIQKGETIISPDEAASYLDAFSKREGEPFSYSDFISGKKGRLDSKIETGLVPLSEIISKGRRSGAFSGSSQKWTEAEVISRYLLLLSRIYVLPDKDTVKKEKRSDSHMNKTLQACRNIRLDAKGQGKKCPGGYTIAANKNCRKKGQLKTPGKAGRKAAMVAGGALAAGAAAAGGAALAYKNREKIVAGVDRAGSAATAASKKGLEKGWEAYSKGSEKALAGMEKAKGTLQKGADRYQAGAQRVQAGVEKGAAKASSGARTLSAAAENKVSKAKERFRGAVEKGSKALETGADRVSAAATGAKEKVREVMNSSRKKKKAQAE